MDEGTIPDKNICQKLVEDFCQVTNTDEACAQFFLQENEWHLQTSLNSFFGSFDIERSDFGKCSEASVSKQVTTKPPKHFRVLSWNLDGLDERSLKRRSKAVIKIIEREKPDIVFLQEIVPTSYAYLEENLPQYRFLSSAPSFDISYFTATLVCVTTVYVDNYRVIPYEGSKMGRNLLIVEAHIGDLKFQLLNTHLESTADFAIERKKQLKIAFTQAKDLGEKHVSILGGDLNIRDKEVREVGLPSDVSDMWEACGRRKECQYTWDLKRNTNKSLPGNFQPQLRFDRIYLYQGNKMHIIPHHFGLVGIEKLPQSQCFPSDHWGIITHFQIASDTLRDSASLVAASLIHLGDEVDEDPRDSSIFIID